MTERDPKGQMRRSSRKVGRRRFIGGSWEEMLLVFLCCVTSWCCAWQVAPGRFFAPIHRTRFGTARRMVLTTPESIIEQASTQKLLDDLIDESVRTSARRPIMLQFDPSSGWIWKRWVGTVFSETWESCLARMAYALVVFLVCRLYAPGVKSWLSGFNILWGQLLSVTTFTLTFFVNQSYALWRKCYDLSRRLQGRLHDLDMTLAAHAARRPTASPNEPSTYTAASRQLLELFSRYVRLFNMLTYSSFTRSHRPMLTPRGMRRLVERGLMTAQEREVLVNCEVPATQRHNAVLLWMVRTFIEGREAGHFQGGPGFEEQFMEKVHVCRASYGAVGDELQGRMPFAYAHIVQVLVDLVIWMYPFMAFSSGMSGLLCVIGTGLLTVSYQGLFDLAKQFLDPYDNESYGKGEDPLIVDTLIAETNAGSIRWMYGLEEYPVNSQRIKDGELPDYLLPTRGYTVEELDQMEEERLQKKLELEKKQEQEERERKAAAEHEARVRKAGEAMIDAIINTTTIQANGLSNPSYVRVNGDGIAGPKLPGVVASVDVAEGATVSKLLDALAASEECMLPSDIVPDNTALSFECLLGDEDEKDEEVKAQAQEDEGEYAPANDEPDSMRFRDDFVPSFSGNKTEDFSADMEDLEEDDAGPTVHVFDPVENYGALPWFEEKGPDGQEIRLSQMMANEVWEEEIEAAKENEVKIKTYEEYAKKMAELKDAQESELLETQDILMASPGAEISTHSKGEKEDGPKYDQTNLDPIYQLWGMQADDLSDMEAYEESPSGEADDMSNLRGLEEQPIGAADEDFEIISQLWGNRIPSAPHSASATVETEPESFDAVSELWAGEFDVDSSEDSDGESFSEESDLIRASDGSETRLSQLLADEVWEEELEAPPVEPMSLKDYTKQVEEILEAEKEELLETEAILNAPPAADMVEVPEMEETQDTNSTDADDLTVGLDILEMDVLPNTTSSESPSVNGDSVAVDDETVVANGDVTSVLDEGSPEVDEEKDAEESGEQGE